MQAHRIAVSILLARRSSTMAARDVVIRQVLPDVMTLPALGCRRAGLSLRAGLTASEVFPPRWVPARHHADNLGRHVCGWSAILVSSRGCGRALVNIGIIDDRWIVSQRHRNFSGLVRGDGVPLGK